MLISKNICINNRRTSMRLDKESWNVLQNICKDEKISLNKLLSMIDNSRGAIGFSSATRIFIISYLRNTINSLKKDKAEVFLNQENLNRFIYNIYKNKI